MRKRENRKKNTTDDKHKNNKIYKRSPTVPNAPLSVSFICCNLLYTINATFMPSPQSLASLEVRWPVF